MDCGPPGSSVHGILQDKNTGVGCHFLLQGIFPTQVLNPGLLHCRQILYCLSHQGSPVSALNHSYSAPGNSYFNICVDILSTPSEADFPIFFFALETESSYLFSISSMSFLRRQSNQCFRQRIAKKIPNRIEVAN